MLIDLAINPFGAAVPDMVEAARTAERVGLSCAWVADHFSGAVVGRPWSRDPFVSLGAIAASTTTIQLGVLVANVTNRHPAQLASAVNSLQSLAPDRVRFGVGSGAAPGSRFAVEHEAIGKELLTAAGRRELLVDSIAALRAIWSGESSFESGTVGFEGLTGVTDGADCPPIIVGASAWSTIEVALAVADGVNVRATRDLAAQLDRLAAARPDGFEVSVFEGLDAPGLGEHATQWAEAGCDRLILGASVPFDLDAIAALADL